MPAVARPTLRLIVGLGNPGLDYARTRHNIGFMLLDRLATDRRLSFTREGKWQGLVARDGQTILLKPQTFMNLSGQSVHAVAQFYRLEPASILVVYDDKDLPLGHLRLREGGSAGGHNGIKSLIQHLGTQDFPRLRIGIGAARGGGEALSSHVLGAFGPEERPLIEKGLDRAGEAITSALHFGFDRAMNLFNRNEPIPSPASPST
jgi:peptidyl-tRNA hydrolase, PTH1 family